MIHSFAETLYHHWLIENASRKYRYDPDSIICVDESFLMFKGQLEIAEALAKGLMKWREQYPDRKRITTKSSDLIAVCKKLGYPDIKPFFNELNIVIKHLSNSDAAEYRMEENNWDSKACMFSYISIYIDKDLSSYRELLSALGHELLHAWQDYRSRIEGESLVSKSTELYDEISVEKPDDSSAVSFVKGAEYALDRFERGGYISQIITVLSDDADAFASYSDFIDALNKNRTFKDYIGLKRAVDACSGNELKDITLAYNKMSGKRLMPHAYKCSLQYRIWKMQNKLDRTLPKLYFDWKESGRIKESLNSKTNMNKFFGGLRIKTEGPLIAECFNAF